MRITTELLESHEACRDHVDLFDEEFPAGVELTIDAAIRAHESGLNVIWLARLLPAEGPGSRRDFALRCARHVHHLCTDERVDRCLAVVERRVADPGSVSDDQLDMAARVADKAAKDAKDAKDAKAAGAAWAARAAAEFTEAAAEAAWAAAEAAGWASEAYWSAAGAARSAERRWQIGQLVEMLQQLEVRKCA